MSSIGLGLRRETEESQTLRLGIALWWEKCQGSSQFLSAPVDPLEFQTTDPGARV